MALITVSLITSPALAVDTTEIASQVIGAEGSIEVSKQVLDTALKMAKSKPAMSTATVCYCTPCMYSCC